MDSCIKTKGEKGVGERNKDNVFSFHVHFAHVNYQFIIENIY